MAVTQMASDLAARLLTTHGERAREMVPTLIQAVAQGQGLDDVSADDQWSTLATELLSEFFTCVSVNDVTRIAAPGSIFEEVGRRCARAGVDADTLAAAIRQATRRTQAQVHRFVLAESGETDPEAVVALLSRVAAVGEEVVPAVLRGHELELADGGAVAAHRLGDLLLAGDPGAADLARELGWPADALVSAIVLTPADAAALDDRSDLPFARHERERDLVLMAPIAGGALATTLRPLLAGSVCTVGPAVPMARAPESLALADRLVDRRGAHGDALVFVDEELLELASTADAMVIAALRRKYFVELDRLPGDVRTPLVQTLHEWLRHWGHRPATADALGVHPQTVSGRINRLRDLLADELDDAQVRSELLVLLTALAAEGSAA
ncbi:helix-turn-helix domain-containing protein [Janibacter sp. YB324]|uniref:helix-turn-helix domain-containing protein n=1 Tax=Janibacter sp. YB324 TaxID=2761047 RepID=UPI0016274FD1|nr:helix-turn-helix domain-containing protein [Janibacter sp. YB324]QNF94980.1 helix-turn-helix domain-containing protein [Janibacter sp. YB324]